MNKQQLSDARVISRLKLDELRHMRIIAQQMCSGCYGGPTQRDIDYNDGKLSEMPGGNFCSDCMANPDSEFYEAVTDYATRTGRSNGCSAMEFKRPTRQQAAANEENNG